MSTYVDATVIAAGVVALGGLGSLFTWVFRRGGHEQHMVSSLQANTDSNKELTGVVKTLESSLAVGFLDVHNRIDKHDIEIAVAKRDIEHLNGRILAKAARDLDFVAEHIERHE